MKLPFIASLAAAILAGGCSRESRVRTYETQKITVTPVAEKTDVSAPVSAGMPSGGGGVRHNEARMPFWPTPGVPSLQASSTPVVMTNSADLTPFVPKISFTPPAEPSFARAMNSLVVTGNDFQLLSLDDGMTYTARSPFNDFKPSSRVSFCCDQVVAYDSRRQYVFRAEVTTSQNGANAVRLFAAPSNALSSWQWTAYDLSAPSPTMESLDMPDLVATDKFLYLTATVVDTGSSTAKYGIVFRIDLDSLVQGTLKADRLADPTNGLKVPKATIGASGGIAVASTTGATNQIVVCYWSETAPNPACAPINVTQYVVLDPGTPATSGGLGWFGRADSRISAAWATGSQVGFAWTAGADGTSATYPSVRMAIVDPAQLTLVHEWGVTSSTAAYAYPSAAPAAAASSQHVGFVFATGASNPALGVGIADFQAQTWAEKIAVSGTDSPASGEWGDYFTVRSHPSGWEAVGFILSGGTRSDKIHVWKILFH